MRTWLATAAFQGRRVVSGFLIHCTQINLMKQTIALALASLLTLGAASAFAQPAPEAGGEASLRLPDLSSVSFLTAPSTATDCS